jgi:hypothetical protein
MPEKKNSEPGRKSGDLLEFITDYNKVKGAAL